MCGCQLFIPQVTSPETDPPVYADADAAASAIADFVAGCYVYGGSPAPGFFTIPVTPLENFQAAWDATINELTFSNDPYAAGSQPDIGFSASLSVSAGAEVTFDLSRTPARDDGTGMAFILVYTCDSTSASPTIVFEENIEDIGTGGTYVWTVADAGTYFFVIGYFNNGNTPFSTATTVSCDVDMAVNPVIARYDSGDPANPLPLEACPKLLLPIQTDSSGDWYADVTEAEAVLPFIANCLAYNQREWISFTAVPSANTLTLSLTAPPDVIQGTGPTWISINLVEGQTFTVSGNQPNVIISTYTDKGESIDYIDGTSPQVSSPAPYTGRYLVDVETYDPGAFVENFVITVTATGLTANPAQLLYDIGLEDCPGRLDCIPE